MNGKQKRSKMVVGAVCVLVASFVLVGGVAADHSAGPVRASRNTGVRFAAYMDALDGAQRSVFDRAWEPQMQEAEAGSDVGLRFRQYLDAMDVDQRSTFTPAWTSE